jgi:phage gp29-like protein
MIAAEKYGIPSIIALFQAHNEAEAQSRARALASMLQSLKSDAAAAVANVDDIKTIGMTGSFDFSAIITLANRSISKAITGQVLATDEAQHGTRAQAEIHQDTLNMLIESDALEIADTLNKTLIPWLVELNFGEGAPIPRFVWDIHEETPWERIIQAIDRGVPISKQALYTRYNIPQPVDGSDAFISPKLSGGGGMFADDTGGDKNFFDLPFRRRTYRMIW